MWQQGRQSFDRNGEFDVLGDYGDLFNAPAENVFVVKMSYWFGR